MTKQDWLTACFTAVGVAAMTLAMTVLPMCWADETPLVEIPALPSAQLMISAMDARVTASATPAPGSGVEVLLTVNSPSRANAVLVPVTITVNRTNLEPMSRSVPPSQQVARVYAVVLVGVDGNGSTSVQLPLKWAVQAPQQANSAPDAQQVMSYQMVLSSPLGGQAAPDNLQTVSVYNTPPSALQRPPARSAPLTVINSRSPQMIASAQSTTPRILMSRRSVTSSITRRR